MNQEKTLGILAAVVLAFGVAGCEYHHYDAEAFKKHSEGMVFYPGYNPAPYHPEDELEKPSEDEMIVPSRSQADAVHEAGNQDAEETDEVAENTTDGTSPEQETVSGTPRETETVGEEQGPENEAEPEGAEHPTVKNAYFKPDRTFAITFSKPMSLPALRAKGSILLKDSQGRKISGTLNAPETAMPTGQVIYFVADQALERGACYSLMIWGANDETLSAEIAARDTEDQPLETTYLYKMCYASYVGSS